jgi:antitoxin VapB
MELDMAMNIKNEEAERLTHELADLTGESLTGAITTAVRERLQKLKDERRGGLAERLDRIAKEAAPLFKEPYRTIDHGEMLYDEKGLPK